MRFCDFALWASSSTGSQHAQSMQGVHIVHTGDQERSLFDHFSWEIDETWNLRQLDGVCVLRFDIFDIFDRKPKLLLANVLLCSCRQIGLEMAWDKKMIEHIELGQWVQHELNTKQSFIFKWILCQYFRTCCCTYLFTGTPWYASCPMRRWTTGDINARLWQFTSCDFHGFITWTVTGSEEASERPVTAPSAVTPSHVPCQSSYERRRTSREQWLTPKQS